MSPTLLRHRWALALWRWSKLLESPLSWNSEAQLLLDLVSPTPSAPKSSIQICTSTPPEFCFLRWCVPLLDLQHSWPSQRIMGCQLAQLIPSSVALLDLELLLLESRKLVGDGVASLRFLLRGLLHLELLEYSALFYFWSRNTLFSTFVILFAGLSIRSLFMSFSHSDRLQVSSIQMFKSFLTKYSAPRMERCSNPRWAHYWTDFDICFLGCRRHFDLVLAFRPSVPMEAHHAGRLAIEMVSSLERSLLVETTTSSFTTPRSEKSQYQGLLWRTHEHRWSSSTSRFGKYDEICSIIVYCFWLV